MFNRLRYLLLIILLIAANQVAGQYIIDKVCVGAVRYYRVDGEPGSTYIWTLTDPFNIPTVLPSTADTVAITWSVIPGTYKLSTIQHSVVTGCDGLLEIGDIEVFEPPTAFAGNPLIFCTPDPYQLSEATASSYSTLLWTTSGDGTFDDDTILNPIYSPGPGDLLTGSVTLTLTAFGLGNGNACIPAVSTVLVRQSALVVGVTATATNVSCFGGNDGTATAIPTGGTGVYTYLWDDPAAQTTITATGLYAGTYTVIVTDGNGCSDTASAVVTEPAAALTVTASSTPVSCNGGSNGTATASPAGGTMPYSYLWSDGQVTNPAINLAAGTYSVTVTDSNLCTASTTVVVTEPAILQATIISQVNATCFGYSDGSATATATGGVTPYSYSWNTVPVQTTPVAINLAAGTYIVTVTDSNFCTSSDTVTITQPPLISAYAGPDTIICETGTYAVLPATAANYSSLSWSTSGDGAFNDPTLLNPVYTPGITDITIGSVTLTLVAHGIVPCPDTTDSMVLTISRQAIVNAGPDSTICQTSGSVLLASATATYTTGLLWTTTGTGIFSDPTILNPFYFPSAADILSGNVTLTITGFSAGPCATVSDQMILNIIRQADAYAGADTLICETQVPYSLSGASASFYVSIQWTTSGSGTFSDPTIVNPTYLPSLADIGSGSVILTLTAYGIVPCADSSSSMVLNISRQAVVSAGPDAVICESQGVYALTGASGSYYTSLLWTTSGSGSFNDPTLLNPVYTPSPADVLNGMVRLSLTGTSTPPCVSATDTMELQIVPEVIASAGPDTTMCQNIPVTIAGSSAFNFSSIQWTHNGTGTLVNPTSIHPTYIAGFNETGIVTLTMTVYSLQPCTDSIVDQMNITIWPLPGGTLSGGATVCENDTVVLTLTFFGTPPITATFTNGVDTITVSNISTSPYAIPIVPPPGTWTYTLIALNDLHCAAPPNQLLGSVTVTVYPLPDVEFYWTNGTQNFEYNFFIDTTITNLGAIGNMILWNWGDGTFGYDSTEVHIFPAPYPYAVTLTVTDTNGCSNSITHIVNVPEPPHAFFDPNDPVCFGQPVCFTDLSWVHDTSTAYITTWIWNYGDGSPEDTVHFPNNPSLCHSYDSSGTYPVTLTVIDDYGFDDTLTLNVVVLPAPEANFSHSPACEDAEVQFTDMSSTNGGGSIISWAWNFGDPLSGIDNLSSLQNPAHTFTGSGITYNVTLIVTNFNNCADTIIIPVYVSPGPPVAFTHDPACSGQPVTFMADTLIMELDSIATWSWDFGDGTPPMPNPISITHTFNPAGLYAVTLTVTDLHGCAKSYVDTLEVHPSPVANFHWSTPTCLGMPVQFTDQSYMPAGFTGFVARWEWNFGDGTIMTIYHPSSPNVQHTFTGAATSYPVTLTVWSNDSCSSSIQKVVDLSPSPVAAFDYSNVTCAGQAVQFTDLSQTNGGGSILSWTWNFDDPGSGVFNTSSLQHPTHIFTTPNQTYNVRLIVVSVSGCSDTVTLPVFIHGLPPVDFAYDTVCLSSITHFDANSGVTQIGAIASWTWDFGDGSPVVHDPVTTQHQYSATGTFTVTLTVMDTAGCFNSVSHSVIVNTPANADFTWNGTSCLGSPVFYTDLSSMPAGSLSYITQWTWDFGDGTPPQTILFPGSPNISHTFAPGANAHIVRLTVMTSDSCVSFVEKTVISIPAPIAAFTYSTVICENQEVQFTDQSDVNGGSNIVQWEWNFGDPASGMNNLSAQQNPSHIFTGPGVFTVTLIVTNADNCRDTITHVLNVSMAPVADFSADTACLGSFTHFTDMSVPNASFIISYMWEFGDGATLMNQPDPVHIYATSGIFNVTLTVTNSSGCVHSTTRQVVVNPLPVAAFSYSAPSCQGAPVTFTNLSTTVPGYLGQIVSWTWNFGDGITTTILFPNNPDITHVFATPALAHTVRLTVKTSDSCEHYCEHIVISTPSPVANFNSISTSCSNQPVQFTDLSLPNGGGPVTNWFWDFDDPPSGTGNNSTLQNPIHSFSGPGTYNVMLIVSNTAGCSDTMVKTVTIMTGPDAEFSSTLACLGSATIFTDLTNAGPGVIVSHLWNFGDGYTSIQANPAHSYANCGFYTVTMTVTTADGCSDDTSMLVQVLCSPTALYSTTAPECAGDTVLFTDQSSTPQGYIVKWEWNFGDGTVVTIDYPGNPNISHVYPNAGTYITSLTIHTTDSCVSTKIHPVNINTSPSANFIFSADPCEEMPVLFTDLTSLNGGGSITQWLWNFGDPGSGVMNTSTLQNPVHVYSQPGTYSVQLTVTTINGCSGTITKTVIVTSAPVAQFSAGLACNGNATQFTDGSFANGGMLTGWLWNFGDPGSGTNNTSNQQNPTHIYSNAGTYSVTLTVTNSGGCADDTVLFVTVAPAPVANFDYSAACVMDSTEFTDLSLAPNSMLTGWLWDFGDGSAPATIQNPKHAYQASGTYMVTLWVTNLNDCVDSITLPVVVRPTPTAAYSFNAFYCPGGQVQFHDESTGQGATIAERLWTFEPGYTSNLPNPVYVFSVTDTVYQVSLAVTDSYGCKDTIIQEVYVKPGFALNFVHDTVCFGSPTHFTPQNLAPGDSLYFVTWNFGDPASGSNNFSNEYDPEHTFTQAGAFTVKMKAWNSDNCVDSVYRNIIVRALPQVIFTASAAPCDSTIDFDDQSTAGSGSIAQWVWDFGDGSAPVTILAPGSGDISHTYPGPGNYTAILTVTNSYGCISQHSVGVQPASCLTASIITLTPASCSGSIVTFADNSTPVSMITGWHWYWGDGTDTAYSAYAPTVQHIYAGPGTFNVRLVVTTLVNTIEWTDTATIQVTVRPSPEAMFTNGTVCEDQPTVFKDQSQSNGELIVSWSWNFGEPQSGTLNISSLTDPTHLYGTQGIYPVTLTVMNKWGCVDSLIKPVRVYGNPVAAFTNSIVCEGNPTYFYDMSILADTLNSRWLWHFGDQNAGGAVSLLKDPVHRYAERGKYNVKLFVADYNGCSDTVDSTITVNPSPLSAFRVIEDLDGRPGRILLNNRSEGAVYFIWDFGNGHSSTEENPVVTYSEDGTYLISLITENEFECFDTTSYLYNLLFKGLFVPNAFAPTGLSTGSQLFKPIGINLKEYHVQVFNMWGETVWESKALDSRGRPVEGWDGTMDGKLLQQGTYGWRVDAVFIDGTIWQGSDIGNGQKSIYGTVTLVR